MNKKEATSRKVAFIHLITSGLIGFFLAATVGFIIFAMLYNVETNLAVEIILGFSFAPIVTWVAVLNGSKYINKTYIINDTRKVVKISTISMILIILITQFKDLFEGDLLNISTSILIAVSSVAAFYFASKKYLKQTQSENHY